jgi:hypothetical protein
MSRPPSVSETSRPIADYHLRMNICLKYEAQPAMSLTAMIQNPLDLGSHAKPNPILSTAAWQSFIFR